MQLPEHAMRAVLQVRCHDAIVFAADCGACHLPAIHIYQMPCDLRDDMNIYITLTVLSLIGHMWDLPASCPSHSNGRRSASLM